MNRTVYLNGDYLPESEARVSIFDRGFLFGDGIYEVIPVINGKLIDRAPFMERFKYSLKAIDLPLPRGETELWEILTHLIEVNQLNEGIVYLQVTRGVAAQRGFGFPSDTPASLTIFTQEKNILNHPLAKTGCEVITTEDLRWKRRDIKSISLLAQCIAKEEAIRKQVFEAWMVDEDGMITEGASSTVYLVKDGVIVTRALTSNILPGIRRKVLLQLVRENSSIKIEERTFTTSEAKNADEAFLTSASTFVIPVVGIDGSRIGNGKPGDITIQLRNLYIDAALEESAAQ